MGTWQQFQAIQTTLANIDYKLNVILTQLIKEGSLVMAQAATLDRLKADVAKNTNLVAAITQSLQGYVATVKDLTDKLQQALQSDDEAAVAAAADALEANNASLDAQAPQVAAAAVEGTPAASQ